MMEDYVQMTIKTYDEIAQDYVETTKAIRPSIEFDIFCQAVRPKGRVLDAGCAWGRDSQAFYERGFEVIGVDLSANLLEIARKFAPNCTFIQADVRQIPLADNYVDGIWCVATLLHLKRSQVPNALAELRRVLRESAPCFIQVKRGVGEETVGQRFSQGKDRFFTYFELDELWDMCEFAGFRVEKGYIYNERDRNKELGRDQDLLNFLLKKE